MKSCRCQTPSVFLTPFPNRFSVLQVRDKEASRALYTPCFLLIGISPGKKFKETRCVALDLHFCKILLPGPPPLQKNTHEVFLSGLPLMSLPRPPGLVIATPPYPPLLSSDSAIFHFLLKQISVASKNR